MPNTVTFYRNISNFAPNNMKKLNLKKLSPSQLAILPATLLSYSIGGKSEFLGINTNITISALIFVIVCNFILECRAAKDKEDI